MTNRNLTTWFYQNRVCFGSLAGREIEGEHYFDYESIDAENLSQSSALLEFLMSVNERFNPSSAQWFHLIDTLNWAHKGAMKNLYVLDPKSSFSYMRPKVPWDEEITKEDSPSYRT